MAAIDAEWFVEGKGLGLAAPAADESGLGTERLATVSHIKGGPSFLHRRCVQTESHAFVATGSRPSSYSMWSMIVSMGLPVRPASMIR